MLKFFQWRKMLTTANTLRNDDDMRMRIALDISQLDKMSVDYSMAAFEAYLNYLFERLIDSPSIICSKTPGFWEQYKAVRQALVDLFPGKNMEVEFDSIQAKIAELREKRNKIHHIKSSVDDYQSLPEREISPENFEDSPVADLKSMQEKTFRNVNSADALSAVEFTKNFIINTHKPFSDAFENNEWHRISQAVLKAANDRKNTRLNKLRTFASVSPFAATHSITSGRYISE